MNGTWAKTLVTVAGVALFAAALLLYDVVGFKAGGWQGGLYFIIAMVLLLPFALGYLLSRFKDVPRRETPSWKLAAKIIAACILFVVVGVLALKAGIIHDGKGEAKLYIAGALMIASAFGLALGFSSVRRRST